MQGFSGWLEVFTAEGQTSICLVTQLTDPKHYLVNLTLFNTQQSNSFIIILI
jgi:hypothetical protein